MPSGQRHFVIYQLHRRLCRDPFRGKMNQANAKCSVVALSLSVLHSCIAEHCCLVIIYCRLVVVCMYHNGNISLNSTVVIISINSCACSCHTTFHTNFYHCTISHFIEVFNVTVDEKTVIKDIAHNLLHFTHRPA